MAHFCSFPNFKQIIFSVLLTLLFGCQNANLVGAAHELESIKLTILYTNDEHGWMEGVEEGRGAASLFERWR